MAINASILGKTTIYQTRLYNLFQNFMSLIAYQTKKCSYIHFDIQNVFFLNNQYGYNILCPTNFCYILQMLCTFLFPIYELINLWSMASLQQAD